VQDTSAGAQSPAFFEFRAADLHEENQGMSRHFVRPGRRAFTLAALAAIGVPLIARAQRADPDSPHKALYLFQGAGREERLLS
jgi:hypothetical protein